MPFTGKRVTEKPRRASFSLTMEADWIYKQLTVVHPSIFMRTTLRWLVAWCLLVGPVAWSDPLPDFVPTVLGVPPVITAPPNPLVTVSWSVVNQGEADSGGYWYDALYLSTQSNLDSSATFLASQNFFTSIQPGESYWGTNTLNIPVVQSGFYYLIVKANLYQYFTESDPTNNDLATGFRFESTPADLVPLSLVVTSSVTGPPNPVITAAWGVTNQGPGYAAGYWLDNLYISTNATFDGSASMLNCQSETGPVPAGGQYWRTNSFHLPVVQDGTYFLFLIADQYDSLHEAQTNNNVLVQSLSVNILPPDLTPLALLAPNIVTSTPNPMLTLTWGVTNQGRGPAIGDSLWEDEVFLSVDTNLDGSDPMIAYEFESGPVAAGETYWRTNDAVLPVVESGNYYLILKAAAWGLYESDSSNNTLIVPIKLTIQRPDLLPLTQFPTEITGPPFPVVTLVYGATNQGVGPALGNWYDYLFFATNAADVLQGLAVSSWNSGPLAAGASYWETNTVRLPVVQDGTFYLAVEAARYSSLYESDPSNNLVSVPITFRILSPDLMPVALQVPTVVTSPPNPELTFIWTITNQGAGPALGNSYWSDVVYLSRTPTWDSTAVALNSGCEFGPVAAGESYRRTNVLPVPVVQSGNYYFILKADASGSLVESDEGNNELVMPVSFTIQPPDLMPLVSAIPTNFTGPPNPALTLVWGVTNQGIGLAQGYWPGWYDGVFFSTDNVLDGQDVDVGGWLLGDSLAPGASEWRTNQVWLPVTQSGTYYLIFKADRNDNLYESNKSNNIAVVPIALNILPPDLAPIALQVPDSFTGPPNPRVTVIWGVTNQGVGPALTGSWLWSDVLYYSRNATLDSSDPVIASVPEAGPVAAGRSYWRTNTLRVPAVRSTNCYLIFKTDAYNSLFEADESNNTVAVPLQINVQPPDLTPLAFRVSSVITSPPNPVVTFVWGVTNQGSGLAEGPWNDQIFISTNETWDSTARCISSWMAPTLVPAGGAYWCTNTVTVPVAQSGSYYFFLVTDAGRSVYESDFANNMLGALVSFTIQPADLAALEFQVPAVLSAPPRPRVPLVWGVTNQGPGQALGRWSDSLYFSSNPVFDYSAIFLGGNYETGPLDAGATYWRTNTRTLPVTQSGTYYLLFETDSGNALCESNTNNNRIWRPITIDIQPPDLAPVALEVTNLVVGPPFPSVTVRWGVTNQGAGAAIPDWYWQDQISLCTGSTPGCTIVGGFQEQSAVASGASYWRTNVLRVPVVTSGTYYFRFDTDINQDLYESCFTNNEITVPVAFQIQPPDLAPIVLQAPRMVTGAPYPYVKLSWGVTNQGAGTALGNGAWSDRVYLSRTQSLDSSASIMAWGWESGPVTPQGNYWRSQSVIMPVTESGDYYLILVTDVDHVLYDANYSNNTIVIPITFNLQAADLAPIAFQAPASVSGLELTSVTFVWGITNQGMGTAGTTFDSGWCDSVYLSTTPQGTWSDTRLFSAGGPSPLPPGGSYWRTNSTPLFVAQSGNYYFILRSDDTNSISESEEANNQVAIPVTISVEAPDLAPYAIQFAKPVVGPPNPSFTLARAVTNLGPGLAFGQNGWYDAVYFSETNVLDGTERTLLFDHEDEPIPPGGSYWRTNEVYAPVLESGQYYLLLYSDVYNYLQEANESNNVLAVPITFEIHPSDVAAIGLQAAESMAGGPRPKLTVSWGVTNQGPTAAQNGGNWLQALYLSSVPLLDSNAVFVGYFWGINSLPGGSTAWFTNQVELPITTSGQYYVLVNVNVENFLHEANTNNDVAVAPLTFSLALPDLAPVALQAPRTLTGPPHPWVTLSWGITNQGVGAAGTPTQGYWNARVDQIFFSSTSNLDSRAFSVKWSPETNTVAPGESYWRTNVLRLPVSESGDYYLFLSANSFAGAVESDYSNNVLTVPLTLTVEPPDLTPLIFAVPSLVTGLPYPELPVVWGVTNQGSGVAQVPPGGDAPLVDAVYLSTTPTLQDPYQAPLATWPRSEPILPGTGYLQTNTVRVPVSSSGTYYLIFGTDAYQMAYESDESNNTIAVPVTFYLSAPPDLSLLSAVVPRTITGAGNPPVTLAWHVANQGFGPSAGSWWDTISLWSPLAAEIPVGSFWMDQPLPAGGDYWKTNTVILPVNDSGNYSLTFRTGTGFGLYDLDPQDNALTVPITISISGTPRVWLSEPQSLPGGVFRVSVYGEPGAAYTLQGSANLQTWSRVLDFVCTRNPMTLYDVEAGHDDRRFYRVAPLTNAPVLRLDIAAPPSAVNSGLWLKVDGPVGGFYRLETSTDLIDWHLVANLSATVVPEYFRDISATNETRRFYRVLLGKGPS